MPDFGRWNTNGGDPSLDEINRTDQFLDALAAQQQPSVPDPTLPSGTASSADLGGKRARVCLSAASLARPRPS